MEKSSPLQITVLIRLDLCSLMHTIGTQQCKASSSSSLRRRLTLLGARQVLTPLSVTKWIWPSSTLVTEARLSSTHSMLLFHSAGFNFVLDVYAVPVEIYESDPHHLFSTVLSCYRYGDGPLTTHIYLLVDGLKFY